MAVERDSGPGKLSNTGSSSCINKEEHHMTLVQFFGAIAKLSGLIFVVTSMVAMGLSLTVPQIIAPLRNVRLVILALFANFVLIPLGIALFIRAQAPETAATYQPVMNKASSLAILILLVVGLGLNVSNILNLIGTGGILALLLFIIASFAIGFVLGLRDPGIRSVMGLGTAQRNISAALVVGAQNFSDPNVITTLLVGAILLLLLLLPTAR